MAYTCSNTAKEVNVASSDGTTWTQPAGKAVDMAVVNADGKINIAHAIQEPALFETHKTTILDDFSSFDKYAYSVISENKSETA